MHTHISTPAHHSTISHLFFVYVNVFVSQSAVRRAGKYGDNHYYDRINICLIHQ